MKSLFLIITIAFMIMKIYLPTHSTVVEEEKVSPSATVHGAALPSPVATEEAKVKTHTTALADIPSDTEWSVIAKYPYRQVIAQIYQGESSFGRHDVCRRMGMYNGFGWRESEKQLKTNGPVCYEDFNQLVSEINNWIDKRVHEGMQLSEINCYYVRGIKASQCDTAYKLN